MIETSPFVVENTPFDLRDKAMIVTGGTQGIGRAVVEEVVRHGGRVVLSGRDQTRCDGVAAEINALAGRECVWGVACDIADRDALDPLIDRSMAILGRIDCLVANAVIREDEAASDPVGFDIWEEQLLANVQSSFHLARRVARPMMVQRAGSIIFMSSATASQAVPSRIAYSSGKAALETMARALAAALASYGIRVNCIAPGSILTPGWHSIADDPVKFAAFSATMPMKRMGVPRDIGAAVVFLASEAGAYVTGIVLPVDGGRVSLGNVLGSNVLAEQL